MAQPTDAAAPPASIQTVGKEAPPPPSTSTTQPPTQNIDDLVLDDPPPLDPEWVQHERDQNLANPRPVVPPLIRQPLYVVECRELTARMTAPGARDQHLADGIRVQPLMVPSTLDGYEIPLLAYSLEENDAPEPSTGTGTNPDPDYAVLYIHGGGLHIGEADSEELPCRRILKDARLPKTNGSSSSSSSSPSSPSSPSPTLVVYSVGYRVMPQHPASTCVADCIDAYRHVRAAHPTKTKLLLIGSSSGGELAAFVSQEAAKDALASNATTTTATTALGVSGVVLRCPVTSDAFNGEDYIPPALRPLHTSAANPRFATTLLGRMQRLVPRDSLPYMPLEAPPALLKAQPRHWIQVCTNDMLYSDGVCYAKALESAGAAGVHVDVVVGWPHTFWLKTPWMDRALEADEAMLRGLAWVAGGP
jgi:acetyl esterase/lipase